MRKPWVIGLLSIFPGGGLLSLGKPIAGIIVFILVALFIFLGIVIPSENISITSYTLALIAWGSQLYYAVLIAQQLKRLEDGAIPALRQVSIAPPPPGASRGEKGLHNARQEVMQLLQPGEYASTAIYGIVGAPSGIASLVNIVLTLLSGTPVSNFKEGQPVFLGITGQDFIHTKTDILGKPTDLQRIPLNQVRLVKLSQGILSDEVAIDTGEGKPLRVRVGKQMRQGTLELARSLPAKSVAPQAPSPSIEPGHLPQEPEITYPRPDIQAKPSGAILSPGLLRQAGISAICMLIGYSAMYGILMSGLFNVTILEEPYVREVVGNIQFQIICGIPSLLPAAFIVAAWVLRDQKRNKLSERFSQITNAIVSLVLGVVAFIPCQFCFLLGVSF
jgi:hypothetical protein